MQRASWLLAALTFGLAFGTNRLEAGERTITSDKYYGCRSREYRDKLTEYAVDGDEEAFKKGLAAGIMVGECTLFNTGDKVFVTDTAVFSGLVKLRPKGGVAEYWTNLEALSDRESDPAPPARAPSAPRKTSKQPSSKGQKGYCFKNCKGMEGTAYQNCRKYCVDEYGPP